MNLVLTKSDWAKYPFVPEATEYIKTLDLKVDSLARPEFEPILNRAESRVKEALLTNPPKVSYLEHDDEVELSSFPVAVLIATATADEFIKKRYALAEARRAYELLRNEDKWKVREVAKAFGWRVNVVTNGAPVPRIYDLKLHFVDFLRNVKAFHESNWKLINRTMLNGEVYLTTQEAARLLQEEIRRHIEAKLQAGVGFTLPPNVAKRVEELRRIRRERFRGAPTIKVEFTEKTAVDAFPPCIRRLYEAAVSGSHLSHAGRFALTSFLLNVGMPPSKIVDLFRSSSDFNERMTRYQVEHIAGLRGSRTKYTPYACDTLRTHGLCPGEEKLCQGIRHPLTYYRRKLMASAKKTRSADQE